MSGRYLRRLARSIGNWRRLRLNWNFTRLPNRGALRTIWRYAEKKQFRRNCRKYSRRKRYLSASAEVRFALHRISTIRLRMGRGSSHACVASLGEVPELDGLLLECGFATLRYRCGFG